MTLISVAAMTSATMPTSNSLTPNGPSATAQAGSRRRGRSAYVTLLTASRYAIPARSGIRSGLRPGSRLERNAGRNGTRAERNAGRSEMEGF